MAVQVGGISIGIGADVSQVMAGFKKAEGLVAEFERRMKNIRLEGVIKGNPFQATTNYIKQTGKELTSVFNKWKSDILDVEEYMNKSANSAKISAGKIIEEYDKISKKMESLKISGSILSPEKGLGKYFPSKEDAEKLGKAGKPVIGGMDLTHIASDLSKLTGFSTAIDNTIKHIISLIIKGGINSEKELQAWFDAIKFGFEKEGKEFLKEYEKFGEQLTGAFKSQRVFDFKSQLQQAEDPKVALRARKEATKELIIAEAELRRNAEAGIGTSKLEYNLIQLYNKAKEKGAFLSGKQKEALGSYLLEQERQRIANEKQVEQDKEITRIQKEQIKVRKDAEREATKAREEQSREDARRLKEQEALVKKHEDFAKRRAKALYGSSDDPREAPRLDSARSKVFQAQADLIIKSRKQIELSTVAIEKGINVEENRKKILQEIEALRRAGVTILDKELLAEKDIEKSLAVQKALKFEAEKKAKLYGITLDKTGVAVSQTPRELGVYDKTALSVTKKRAELIVKIKQENIQALEAIRQNFDVEKNSEKVLRNITKLKELGAKLSEKEAVAEKGLYDRTVGIRLKQATDAVLIDKKRKEATDNLRIAEARLLAEAKAGIDTENLRTNIMTERNKALKAGAYLTKAEREELKQYNQELAKTNKRGGFLSKEWFVERARWFLQLRAFWGIYRSTGEAVQSLVDYETQLSRAMRTARSETKSSIEVFHALAESMKEATGPHAASWEQIGETLYQLGSAGLSAEQSIAALNSTLSLIVGTEGDARDVTKSVAGVYNNFKDTLEGMTSEQEKFLYINNLMAAAWRDHQVEISELTDGYARASSVARVVGVSLKDLTSILSVANDHMIKGGNAGRALAAVWSRMSKDVDEFADVFQLDIDTSQPLKFMEIMDQLSVRFKAGALSVDQLGDMFERMGLRGAPIFATLVKNWEEINVAGQKFNNIHEAAAEIERQKLDNISGQWQKFLGHLRAYVTEGKVLYDLVKSALEFINKIAETGSREIRLKTNIAEVEKDIEFAKNKINEFEERYKKLEEVYDRTGSYLVKANMKHLERSLVLWKRYLKNKEIELEESNKRLEEISITPDEKKYAEKDPYIEHLETMKRISKEYNYMYEAQKNFYRLRAPEDAVKKMKKARAEEAEQIVKVNKELSKALALDQGKAGAQWKRTEEAQKLLNQLKKDRITAENEVNKATRDRLTGTLSLYKEQEELQVQSVDYEIKRLSYGAGALNNQEEINELLKKREIHENNIAEIQASQDALSGKDVGVARETLRLKKEANKEEGDNLEIKTDLAALQVKLNILAEEYNEKLDAQKQGIEIAKINHASQLDIVNLEKESLDTQKEYLNKRKALIETLKRSEEKYKQLASINKEIRDLNLEILRNQEEQNRRSSILYDWMQRLKDTAKEWHDIATETLVTFSTGIATGTAGVFTDLTGGFQEQQQEVENLKGELAELGKELDEAISEGDVERAEEIKNQMKGLKDEINDLEDPIHNMGKAFKDFFKELIDNIRSAINEWIAMQIVMGIVSKFVPTGLSQSQVYTQTGAPSVTPKLGTGGVLPNIEAFKSFSAGGITSRPTLALLGDNRSKKEIVIPTENIRQDSVSGYMRDSDEKQGITIVNLLTREDIYSVMGQEGGHRVIINSVGKDLQNGGPLSKRMRV